MTDGLKKCEKCRFFIKSDSTPFVGLCYQNVDSVTSCKVHDSCKYWTQVASGQLIDITLLKRRLIEKGFLDGFENLKPIDPRGCIHCACTFCGRHKDTCVCDHNTLIDIIENIKKYPINESINTTNEEQNIAQINELLLKVIMTQSLSEVVYSALLCDNGSPLDKLKHGMNEWIG